MKVIVGGYVWTEKEMEIDEARFGELVRKADENEDYTDDEWDLTDELQEEGESLLGADCEIIETVKGNYILAP